jgi:hypothetical protein
MGAVAVICVALSTVKVSAGSPSKVTAVVPVKFVPVMMTVVLSSREPTLGDMLDIVGAGAAKALETSAIPVNAIIKRFKNCFKITYQRVFV